jgi:glycerol kinase
MQNQGKYIMALDQGTTSSRAILFNKKGEVISISQKPFQQYFPKPGWVEHNAEEIWDSQLNVTRDVIKTAGITTENVAAIGITNQRETTIVWDRHTGKPIYNAIVWQDRRTSAYCNTLKDEGHSENILKKTGLVIDAYFSATKIRWILDNVNGAREKAEKGDLLFGTIDSWLIYKFSGGKSHLTDVTNASRTMLYNIHELKWDDELLELFTIPKSMLPEVKSCSEIFCEVSTDILPGNIRIAGVAGDQQAALFGQLCLEEGMLKTTYGTGCFMVMNTGKTAVTSNNKLLTTIAWKIDGEVNYALEGSVFVGGAAIQWLRDGLNLFKSAEQSEELALQVPDNGGVYFVPALTGLGAPYWDQEARGAFFGITRGTTGAHISRAALESIAFQVYDVLKSMESDYEQEVKEMRVDGGAVANNLLMQFQSDITRTPLNRPQVLETTALGAAYLAGLAVGYWKNIDELKAQWKSEKTFLPSKDEETVAIQLAFWRKAVNRTLNWLD